MDSRSLFGNHETILSMKGILGVYHVLALTLKGGRAVLQSARYGDSSVHEIKREWGLQILEKLETELRIKGDVPKPAPFILVGNHISYLDIPVLCALVAPRFVAKHEVSKWPIIGKAGLAGGTIFVKRGDKSSMANVRKQVVEAIVSSTSPVVIFPSGTTSMNESCPWKPGAFAIAKETSVPVIPFRIRYNPLRLAAYIDDDTFIPHLMNWARQTSKYVQIEFGAKCMVTDVEKDCEKVRQWASQFLSEKQTPSDQDGHRNHIESCENN